MVMTVLTLCTVQRAMREEEKEREASERASAGNKAEERKSGLTRQLRLARRQIAVRASQQGSSGSTWSSVTRASEG